MTKLGNTEKYKFLKVISNPDITALILDIKAYQKL